MKCTCGHEIEGHGRAVGEFFGKACPEPGCICMWPVKVPEGNCKYCGDSLKAQGNGFILGLPGGPAHIDCVEAQAEGQKLLDYYAAHAMQAMLSKGMWGSDREIADGCFKLAQVMLQARRALLK